MKKKLLWLGYCVPYAFLALYGDAVFGSVWGYVLLLGAAVVYSRLVRETSGRLFWWGNALSAVVSILCTWLVCGSRMNYYFKPFGAAGWVMVLSAVSLVIQWLVRKKEWLVLGLVSGAVGLMLLSMYSLQWSM